MGEERRYYPVWRHAYDDGTMSSWLRMLAETHTFATQGECEDVLSQIVSEPEESCEYAVARRDTLGEHIVVVPLGSREEG